MAFLAGEDVELDRELLLFDLQASSAHARGLRQAGILDDDELDRLLDSMKLLEQEVSDGVRELDSRFEDGHSAIESWLTEMLGELGGKIHTGRSRNDQVAVALRLYMKDRLGQLAAPVCRHCLGLAGRARSMRPICRCRVIRTCNRPCRPRPVCGWQGMPRHLSIMPNWLA